MKASYKGFTGELVKLAQSTGGLILGLESDQYLKSCSNLVDLTVLDKETGVNAAFTGVNISDVTLWD